VVGSGGFVPTPDDIASVEAWFAEYDSHVAKGDVERMADMALFPLNIVSDDDQTGNGSAAQQNREEFIQSMSHVVGDPADLEMKSERTPIFLTKQLVLVVTNATFTVAGHSQPVRYADLLVKQEGRWLFQTMVQGGWGNQLSG
jgi:hypothetical protein